MAISMKSMQFQYHCHVGCDGGPKNDVKISIKSMQGWFSFSPYYGFNASMQSFLVTEAPFEVFSGDLRLVKYSQAAQRTGTVCFFQACPFLNVCRRSVAAAFIWCLAFQLHLASRLREKIGWFISKRRKDVFFKPESAVRNNVFHIWSYMRATPHVRQLPCCSIVAFAQVSLLWPYFSSQIFDESLALRL